MKQLKVYNGVCYINGKQAEAYVAATSVADLVRVLEEAGISRLPVSYINKFWNKGCWGLPMEGVLPERGVWVSLTYHDKPIRWSKHG